MSNHIMVVGAGITGATIARVLAEAGMAVQVIEKREVVGGNCFDYVNSHGICVHRYGPHIFHTSSERIWGFLSGFTEWVDYRHRVKALLGDGRFVTLPPNLQTMEIIGRDRIADTLFIPYTMKMWGIKDIRDIDPEILKRVSVQENYNDLYFPNDRFQGLPKNGYTEMIRKMLDHPNITVVLGVDFRTSGLDTENFPAIFNSMAIDEYFGFSQGPLRYRSLKFHLADVPKSICMKFPTCIVNFTDSGPFTRASDWSSFPNSGRNEFINTVTYEEPCEFIPDAGMERLYPIKDAENLGKYEAYLKLVPSNMRFVGRCGTYRYIDMDDAVEAALDVAQKYISESSLRQ